MDSKFNDFYTKRLLITRILWIALTMSICMFGVVLFVINKEPFEMNLTPLLSGQDPLLLVCTAVGVVLAAATFQGFEIYRNRVIRERWDRATFLNSLRSARGKHGEAIYTAADLEYVSTLDDRSMGIFRLHTRLMVAYILRFALTEMIAIFGFLAAHQHSNISLFIPFGAVALVLMVVYFPKSEMGTQVV
jgi:hypothetical protein